MAIPLTLRSPGPGRLVYGLPRWYRPLMGLILALLAAGLALGGLRPGLLAWTVLAGAVASGLYQESWSFDAGAGQVVGRWGLWFAPRRTVLALDGVLRFRLAARSPGLDLVMECADGSRHLLEHQPARLRERLRDQGGRIAALCRKPLSQ